MSTTVEEMCVGDLDAAAELTAREGWASGRSDFEMYLAHDPDGCFVARSGDECVGMVTSTRYAESGWVGNLIVVPEHRGRGIGRRLMRHALQHLEEVGIDTVRLDGDPPGIALYRSLGFVDEWESLRFRTIAHRLPFEAIVEPIGRRDVDVVAAFDGSFFGDDRGRLLGRLLEASVSAFAVRKSGQMTGYVVATRSSLGLRIGPCVATDRPSAGALLSAVLANAEGEVLTVGVPGPNREARRILESLGFEPTPSSRRMVRGPIRCCGLPNRIFAITNGAVG